MSISAAASQSGRGEDGWSRRRWILALHMSMDSRTAAASPTGFSRSGESRLLNIYVYLIMAYDATVGVKHGRLEWLGVYRLLRMKGGLRKVLKHTFLDIFGGNKKPVR